EEGYAADVTRVICLMERIADVTVADVSLGSAAAVPFCLWLVTLLYAGPAAAGGLIDIVPRTLSNFISVATGVPVIVENEPGGGGNIAASVVAKAAPDGHALLVTDPN